MRPEPSQASTQTQRICGITSQNPFSRTPPQGPLRNSLGQFMGQDIPVWLSTQCPHIRQSNNAALTRRSVAQIGASIRSYPIHNQSGCKTSIAPSKCSYNHSSTRALRTDHCRRAYISVSQFVKCQRWRCP